MSRADGAQRPSRAVRWALGVGGNVKALGMVEK